GRGWGRGLLPATVLSHRHILSPGPSRAGGGEWPARERGVPGGGAHEFALHHRDRIGLPTDILHWFALCLSQRRERFIRERHLDARQRQVGSERAFFAGEAA